MSTDRPRTDDKLTLQDVLAVEAVGVQTMTGVMGDGWALQFPCGFCEPVARRWLGMPGRLLPPRVLAYVGRTYRT